MKARAPKEMEKTKESTFTGSLIQTTTEKAVSRVATLLRRRSRPLTSVVLTKLRLGVHRFHACSDYEVEPGRLMERARTWLSEQKPLLKPKSPSSIPRGRGEGRTVSLDFTDAVGQASSGVCSTCTQECSIHAAGSIHAVCKGSLSHRVT